MDSVASCHGSTCKSSELKHTERKKRKSNNELRPTSSRTRSAIISMLGPDGAAGITALDLYAGTGAVGFDLLEHGAARVDFVEIDRRRAADIDAKIAARRLGDRAKTYQSDAIRVLPRLVGTAYDLVFVDPPYDIDPWGEIIDALKRHELLTANAWVMAEHSTRNSLPEEIAGAKAINHKRYGDSSITIYRFPEKQRP